MLFALGDPLSFVVLVVSFLGVVTLHAQVRRRVARLRSAESPLGLAESGPWQGLDPYACVAAAISGVGWSRPPADVATRSSRRWLLLLAPAVDLALGLAALAYAASRGLALSGGASQLLQQGVSADLDVRISVLLGLTAVYTGLVSLVPLPPVDGGRLLLALAPRTPGWEKARYRLAEQGFGLLALLLLLVVPLGGPRPVGLAVLDAVAGPLLRLVTGA